MSTDGSEHTAFAYQVMAISILINVLLYSIFGLLLFFISKLIRR
jgi:site-specific recombinase